MVEIDVRNLEKWYGNFRVLHNINLNIWENEFFGLFGPNGAGKTTLLKILTGQIVPTDGYAMVSGIDVVGYPIAVKKQIGIVPESESPPSFLTAREYLNFVGRIREVEDLKDRVDYWLDYFDFREKENVLCKDMSKGMRQKMMLASAFIHSPELLFLDEPFINLDPIYQKRVREYLKWYMENGGTVFMCTHILEIAEKLCSRVGVIHKGKIIALGTIDELKQNVDENLEAIFMRLVGE